MAAIDELLPSYDFHEVRSVELPLDPEQTIAVVGASGTPWRPRGGIRGFHGAPPGTVRIGADFRADGRRLTTETRIAATDDAARRAFLRYRRVVGPFAALIRRRRLARIARGAR